MVRRPASAWRKSESVSGGQYGGDRGKGGEGRHTFASKHYELELERKKKEQEKKDRVREDCGWWIVMENIES